MEGVDELQTIPTTRERAQPHGESERACCRGPWLPPHVEDRAAGHQPASAGAITQAGTEAERLMKLGFQVSWQLVGGSDDDGPVASGKWFRCHQGLDVFASFDEILSFFSKRRRLLHCGVLLPNRE